MIRIVLPLTLIPDPNLTLLEEAGKPDALNREIEVFDEREAEALAQVNELLNDGHTLIFRERVTTQEGESLILFFHKAPAPAETPEQTAIKEAYRIYQTPPQMGGAGEHPDTLRLNAIIKVLIKSGLLPDDIPLVTDDTQLDVTPRTLREGSR